MRLKIFDVISSVSLQVSLVKDIKLLISIFNFPQAFIFASFASLIVTTLLALGIIHYINNGINELKRNILDYLTINIYYDLWAFLYFGTFGIKNIQLLINNNKKGNLFDKFRRYFAILIWSIFPLDLQRNHHHQKYS